MRKLSQIPATNLGEVIPGQAYGLRAYDALAYDKVSNSPTLGKRKESTLAERREYINPDTHAGATCVQPYNAMAVRHVLAGGVHPAYNYRAWLVANSLDNVLLPTAANDLCPRCGLTVSCKCDKFDRRGHKLA